MVESIRIKERDRIVDFERSFPKQLEVWELLDIDSKRSYLMGLWDMLPKWTQTQPSYVDGQFLKPITRRFMYDNLEFELNILPAKIETAPSEFKDYFPTHREEFIEQAVRKLSFSKEQRAILSHKKDESKVTFGNAQRRNSSV